MPRATKNSGHVMDTSVNQETSMISQDSSSSDQEVEVQSPQCFHHTSQPQSFVQCNVYALYQRAQDGLDCE